MIMMTVMMVVVLMTMTTVMLTLKFAEEGPGAESVLTHCVSMHTCILTCIYLFYTSEIPVCTCSVQ